MRNRVLLSLSLLAGIAFVSALDASGVARAQAPTPATGSGQRTSALSWLRLEGADVCVPTQELARAVEVRLGRKVFVPPSEADLSIEAHVRLSGARYRAVVTVRDGKGTQLGRRELDDSRCENLTDPLSLVIALMIDPDAAMRKPLPTPAPPDASVAEAEPALIPAPPPEPQPPQPPQPDLHRDPPSDTAPFRGEVNASGGFSLGRVPQSGPLVKVSGWLKPLHWPGVAAGLTYGFDQAVPIPTGAEARVGLLTGFAAFCPIGAGFWTPAKRGYVIACAGLELGMLRARGVGFDRNTEHSLFLVNAQVNIELSVVLVGPLVAHFAPTVFVPFKRDEINYRAADNTDRLLFRMSRLGASFEAGLGLRFQ